MLRLALVTPGPDSLDTFPPFIRMCPTGLTNPFLAILTIYRSTRGSTSSNQRTVPNIECAKRMPDCYIAVVASPNKG